MSARMEYVYSNRICVLESNMCTRIECTRIIEIQYNGLDLYIIRVRHEKYGWFARICVLKLVILVQFTRIKLQYTH